MERFEHIEGTWRRSPLNVADVPKEFIDWWRTVPQECRYLYLYGGMHSMIVAFKNGQQVEAQRTRLQVERLTQALDATLAYMQSHQGSTPPDGEIEQVIHNALVALNR